MSNPDHGHNLEDALIHARYMPDESFAADLHARLHQQIADSTRAETSARQIAEGKFTDIEELPMSPRFRWIAAFSVALLALMVYLFIRLVLVRPTGFAVPPTPDSQVTTVDALFGEEITLTSYDVTHIARTWDITLYWIPEAQPSMDYQISIIGMSGSETLYQQDEPLLGTDLTSSLSTDRDLPTTRWQPRRLITSHHILTIPDGQPIPVALFVGLDDQATGIHPNVTIDDSFLLPPQVLIWGDPGQPTAAAVMPGPAPTATPALEPTSTSTPDAVPTAGGPITRFVELAISADGSWLAVEVQRQTGSYPQILLVSPATGESSFVAYGAWPALTADGHDTVFVIQPRSGDPLNWNRENLINLYDREEGAFSDISSSIGGLPASTMPAVSADGSVIAFMGRYGVVEGLPSNPVNGDVVVYDRRTGTAERVAYPEYSAEPYFTTSPSLSADGRYVAFTSRSFGEGTTQPSGVFVVDRQTMDYRYIADGFFPQISPDGSVIAYLTRSPVNGQGDGWINAAATNLITGETRWLGRVLDQGPDGMWSERVFSLSQDASLIAFWSVLPDPLDPALPAPPPPAGLGSAYPNQFLFVYDWAGGSVTRIDSPDLGGPGDGRISHPALSADGKRLAYLWQSMDREQFGVFLFDWEAALSSVTPAATRCLPIDSPGSCP